MLKNIAAGMTVTAFVAFMICGFAVAMFAAWHAFQYSFWLGVWVLFLTFCK